MELSEKQSLAWKYLHDETTTEVLFGGAAGGGKSRLGCVWQIDQRVRYPGTRGLIGRKVLKDIKQSTLVTFFDACGLLGYQPLRDFRYHPNEGTVKFKNGSIIVLKELALTPTDPDFQSLASMEYTDAFIDQPEEVTEKAFEIVKSRLRYMHGQYGLHPKILLTPNPTDNWLKWRFVKGKKGTPVHLEDYQKYVPALLKDNPDPKFQERYRKLLMTLSDYDRQRLLEGDWDAQPRTGKEFYFNFNPKVHLGRPEYDPNLPLHITFDFNVNPYMTLLVAQIVWMPLESLYEVRFLKEYCLEHPDNTTPAVCKAFLEDFKRHAKRLFYYGDFTGKNRNALGAQDSEHYFAVIENKLWNFIGNDSDRVIPNPSGILARDFLIDIFSGQITNIRIVIHEEMDETRKDFMYMKQGRDGLKHKEKIIDPITMVSYEKYGHTSDALQYLICSAFDEDFEEFKSRKL